MRSRNRATASASTAPSRVVPGADALDHRSVGQRVGQVEPPGQLVQPGQPGLGVGHGVRGHLDGRPVVGPEHEQPVGAGVAAVQQVGRAR